MYFYLYGRVLKKSDEFMKIPYDSQKKEYLNFLSLERSFKEFIAKNGKVNPSIRPPEVNLALKINNDEDVQDFTDMCKTATIHRSLKDLSFCHEISIPDYCMDHHRGGMRDLPRRSREGLYPI